MNKFRMGYLDEDESDIARFYDFIKNMISMNSLTLNQNRLLKS